MRKTSTLGFIFKRSRRANEKKIFVKEIAVNYSCRISLIFSNKRLYMYAGAYPLSSDSPMPCAYYYLTASHPIVSPVILLVLLLVILLILLPTKLVEKSLSRQVVHSIHIILAIVECPALSISLRVA